MPDLEELNQRFAIPDSLQFIEPAAGFPVALVNNSYGEARIALQGAQVLSWGRHNEPPVIWLSDAARFLPGKSVRGGIPLCWPWFGPHPTESSFPSHGFARTVAWQLASVQQLAGGAVQLAFHLALDKTIRHFWPYDTPVECRIEIGQTLSVSLQTRNATSAPIELSEALHTYFMIGDVSSVRVLGLEDCTYLDKVAGMQRKSQQGPVTIAGEVDRIYLDHRDSCIIDDPVLQRRIHITKQHSASTIVWNPWINKAQQMGDLGEQGYRHMLCVESGNAADNRLTLAPGETHQLQVIYLIEQ